MIFKNSRIVTNVNGREFELSRKARIPFSDLSIKKAILVFKFSWWTVISFVIILLACSRKQRHEMPEWEFITVKTLGILGVLFLAFCLYCMIVWFFFNRHYLLISSTRLIYTGEVDDLVYPTKTYDILLSSIRYATLKHHNEGFGIELITDSEPLYLFHASVSNISKRRGNVDKYYRDVLEEYEKIVVSINLFLDTVRPDSLN